MKINTTKSCASNMCRKMYGPLVCAKHIVTTWHTRCCGMLVVGYQRDPPRCGTHEGNMLKSYVLYEVADERECHVVRYLM
jgi:hypothetical protein